MLCSFATMVTLQLVGGHLFSSSGLTCPAGLSLVRPIWDLFLLPLLSSACCGIQLVINALVGASGCAGFNKWFGPLRPYFLGCLFSTTAVSIFRRHGNFRFVWLQCILAFLPELVHLWNLHGPQRQIGATPSHTVDLSIASMGCVACIKKAGRRIPKKLASLASSFCFLSLSLSLPLSLSETVLCYIYIYIYAHVFVQTRSHMVPPNPHPS